MRPSPVVPASPKVPVFGVAEAGLVKRALQALDETLRTSPQDQHAALTPADVAPTTLPRPTYVDGSEDVWRLVQSLTKPNLIPNVYLTAYTSALHACPFANTDGAPSFSDILRLLPELDSLCGTTLTSFFNTANAHVRPFPFLRLPAELRMRVYDFLLPNFPYVPLVKTPWAKDISRPPLALLRVSRQLHDECAKYIYGNRVLFMFLAHDPSTKAASDSRFARRYETMLIMRPSTRALFTRLEITVTQLRSETVRERRYHDIHIPSHSTDDEALRAFFALLPNLQSVLISFTYAPIPPRANMRPDVMSKRDETVAWLRRCVPEHVQLRWDLSLYSLPLRNPRDPSFMEKLGPVALGESVHAHRYTEFLVIAKRIQPVLR